MPARSVRRWLLGGLAWALAQVGAAASEPALPAVELPAAQARSVLGRIHNAASQRNYHGTLVLNAAGSVSTSRVTHYQNGGRRVERIEALDGRMRQVFRHNDVVQTVWPADRLAVIEQREALAPFPGLLQGSDTWLEHYQLRAEGTDRIAGHDTEVFQLRPRDEYRFAQRLWAERQTGLLLRVDVLGPQQEVLESTTFSEIAIGVRPQPETVLQAMRKLDGYRVWRPAIARTTLDAEGWVLAKPVPGFRAVNCVRRPLDAPGTDEQVVQAIFSDGLTHVSLFIEPYNVQRHSREMRTAIGATHTMMVRRDDAWITAMGDVPAATLRLFVQALERRR